MNLPLLYPSKRSSACVAMNRLPDPDHLTSGKIRSCCVFCQIPGSGCTVVDLVGGVLRLEVLLGKMSYMLHTRE